MLKNDNVKESSPLVISGRQFEHNKAHEGKALDKILKTIYDLKAEVGALRKAMDRHGISPDGETEPKNGKGVQFEKQKQKFAGIAKRKENWVIFNPSLLSRTANFQLLILMRKNNVMVIVGKNVPRSSTGQ
jgi:hypothetical protein